MKRRSFQLSLAASALALSVPSFAQTKWDLPAAYPASNFHTVNIQQFADDVDRFRSGIRALAGPGERIAMVSDNRAEMAMSLYSGIPTMFMAVSGRPPIA